MKRAKRAVPYLDALEIARVSEAPAIATDADDRILGCNQAAQELLDLAPEHAVGKTFAQVFRPLDIFNNPLSYDSSLFLRFLAEGRPLRNFQCNLKKASGQYQQTAVSVVTVLGPAQFSYHLVYMLWPVMRRRKADEVIARLLNRAGYAEGEGLGEGLRDAADGQSILTGRQVEVLRSVAEGKSTGTIASELGISSETVRNHVRNVLSRLGVHSRVEAVSVAYQQHLI